jgi:nitroimidazol reductase NimA-like FMN-containing flavoprotein (pyridoxamine 5'-phosphate oxidase superfamily)
MSLTMTVAEREQFLSDLHVGIVAIPRKNKGPLAVPIWYDYEPGGEVWMMTNQSSIKGKLLDNASRISLCVQTEAAPYQYVSVEGPFSMAPTEDGQLLHMATRYLGEAGGKAYAEGSNDSGGDSIVISIKTETWFTVDYNKS